MRALWIFCSYFSLHCPSCIFLVVLAFIHYLDVTALPFYFIFILLEAIMYMGSSESC